MYHRKYDCLPINYWILNQGDVDILKLDVGEEVIENTETNDAEPLLSADIQMSFPNEAVAEAVSWQYSDQHNNFDEEMKMYDFVKEQSHQLLLELPNNCTLMLCFQCIDETVKFHEQILAAKQFQVKIF